MVRELVRDEKILSVPCEPATAQDAQLAQDLADTLESLDDVACLAANQIGETKQVVAFLDDTNTVRVMLNPKLLRALYPIKTEEECMTLDYPTRVTRYGKINVGYDELKDGELVGRKRDYQGNTAQAIQHGIDHCKGKLV